MRLVPTSVDSVAGEVADPLSCRIIPPTPTQSIARKSGHRSMPAFGARMTESAGWDFSLARCHWISAQPSREGAVRIVG